MNIFATAKTFAQHVMLLVMPVLASQHHPLDDTGIVRRLEMKPSALWPPCRVEERIFHWIGVNRAPKGMLNHLFLFALLVVASRSSLRDSGSYGSGLRKFHIFCNILSVPEWDRLPASFNVLHSFAL